MVTIEMKYTMKYTYSSTKGILACLTPEDLGFVFFM